MGSANSVDEAVQAATKNQRLRPGRDGLVLTRGGDIAHIMMSANYDVDAPERFVYCVEDDSPDPNNPSGWRNATYYECVREKSNG